MWRETTIDGVLIAPIVPYALVALGLYVVLRLVLVRLGLQRWTWNTPLAETGLYVCILSALVVFF